MTKHQFNRQLKIIAVMLSIFILSSCAKKTESIKFINKETSISVGDILPLQTTITPSDATNQEVTFISSDQDIASIEDKELYAVAEGNVTVTVLQDNIEYNSLSIQINPILATDIIFQQESIDLGIGRSIDIIANLIPKNTTDKTIKYSTPDSSVVQINGNTVTALSSGTAVITATHSSGLTTKYTVNVVPVLPDNIEISGVSFLHINSTEILPITFDPIDTTDKSITWTSSDKNIISINNGIITAKKIGTTTITALHASGIAAMKEIEVTPILAEKVTLSSKSGNTLYAKESLNLIATVLPKDTTDKSIIWSSDDPSIASVKNGKVTGVSIGSTTIRATNINQVVATYKVNVKPSTQEMKVTISAYCSGYNHVGNEWGTYFSINGSRINSGNILTITRNKDISVYTKIEEYDSIPDIGTASYSMTVNTEYFKNGFIITQTIYVRENRGRYSGNIAKWTVKYEFTPAV